MAELPGNVHEKIGDYFEVSTDYLLGKASNMQAFQELLVNILEDSKNGII